jgi:non-specific protein-tyrosine kinase
MVLAFLLEQLDTRVRDERQMTEILGMSALSHLPPLGRRSPEVAGVDMLSRPSGPMAEAIRVLRGNLGFVGVDSDVRSVLVTSAIRSEGKSVTACNLAVSLALAGQRVVLVDADMRRPSIHSYMRVSNSVGLSSVLARRAQLSGALIPISLELLGSETEEIPVQESLVREGASGRVMSRARMRGVDRPAPSHSSRQSVGASGAEVGGLLHVLPSGPLPPNPGEMAASQRFEETIDLLVGRADLVILDAPPILEVGDAAAISSKTDGALFVANMGRVKLPMLERSRAQLDKFSCRKLGMVVVATKHTRTAPYGYEYRYGTHSRGTATSTDRS